MKNLNIIILGLALIPQFCMAETVVKTIAGPSDTPNYSAIEPYWVKKPTIEVLGRSKVEYESNYAKMKFTIYEIDRNSDIALLKVTNRTKPTIDKIYSLLGKSGRIEVNYGRSVNYQQYKDKDGNKVENEREDKIDNYVIGWNIIVETKDLSLIPQIRAEILSIENSKMSDEIQYSFDPTPKQQRELFSEAIEDGKERAKLIADAHGLKLKLLTIQEGRSECLSSPTGYGITTTNTQKNNSKYGSGEESVVVTGTRIKARPADLMLPASPDIEVLESLVCMVYALEK